MPLITRTVWINEIKLNIKPCGNNKHCIVRHNHPRCLKLQYRSHFMLQLSLVSLNHGRIIVILRQLQFWGSSRSVHQFELLNKTYYAFWLSSILFLFEDYCHFFESDYCVFFNQLIIWLRGWHHYSGIISWST